VEYSVSASLSPFSYAYSHTHARTHARTHYIRSLKRIANVLHLVLQFFRLGEGF